LRLRLAKSYVVGISVLEEETLALFKMFNCFFFDFKTTGNRNAAL
jgi:hypothetical protein